jgi:hypothetical protein
MYGLYLLTESTNVEDCEKLFIGREMCKKVAKY